MRRVVLTPCLLVAALVGPVVLAGCANTPVNTDPPTIQASAPQPNSITETQLSGDQLVRVTGTVVATDAPGCVLLDTGTTRYLLIGGDPKVLEPDETVTVTGNANPQTPTPCTGGTPLTVSEAVAAD